MTTTSKYVFLENIVGCLARQGLTFLQCEQNYRSFQSKVYCAIKNRPKTKCTKPKAKQKNTGQGRQSNFRSYI